MSMIKDGIFFVCDFNTLKSGGDTVFENCEMGLKKCEIEKGGKKNWEIVNWKEVVIWEKGLK